MFAQNCSASLNEERIMALESETVETFEAAAYSYRWRIEQDLSID